jgi:hypothetical protein
VTQPASAPRATPPPRPARLAALDPPPPRPDANTEAANRAWDRYFTANGELDSAYAQIDALADELDDRDYEIAALTARLVALGTLTATGWVAAGVLFLLLALRMLGGL